MTKQVIFISICDILGLRIAKHFKNFELRVTLVILRKGGISFAYVVSCLEKFIKGTKARELHAYLGARSQRQEKR